MNLFGTQQTPFLVLSNIIVLCYLYRSLKPVLVDTNYISSKRVLVTQFLMLLFCLFSFWGTDWYGYLNYFTAVKSGWEDRVPMEDVYIWLMEVLPSYLLFRFIVWGGALLLLLKSVSNFEINKKLFLFLFCSIFLIWFTYARASLGMAMMLC